MQTRAVGRSGLRVGRLGLGTAGWAAAGGATSADDDAAQIVAFVDAGGSLLSTAAETDSAAGEELVGQLLGVTVGRDAVTLAGATSGGSRRSLLAGLDATLSRLATDHLDLWLLRGLDPAVPLEEALAAVDTAVATGRVLYVGVSSLAGWELAAAASWQRAWPGRAPVVAAQVEWSLLRREAEAEVVPAAQSCGVGLLPAAPLGRGVLTGKYRRGMPADARGAGDGAEQVAPYRTERTERTVDAVLTAADGLGVSPVAVALAWVRDRPGVVAPIVGATTAAQLSAALAAEDLTLPEQIATALDDASEA